MPETIDHPTVSLPRPRNPPPDHMPSARGRIFRRLAWSGVILLIVFVALSFWTVLLRSSPAAYTLLRISRQPPWVIFPHGKEAQAGDEFELYGKAQVALVKIRPVLNAALRRPGAAPGFLREQVDPIDWLEKHLEVTFDKETGFLRIALRNGLPKERIILVEAVREAYLEEVVYKENDMKLRRLSRLKGLYLKSEQDLRQKRRSLKDMAKSGPNEKFLEVKQRLKNAHLDALERELIENLSELRKVEVKLALAERGKKSEDVARYQAELEYLKEMRKKLENDLEAQAREVRDVGYAAMDLDFFQKEIDSLDNLTKVIAAQKQQLEIELDAPPRIVRLQDAILEDGLSGTRNYKDVWHDVLSWLGL